MINIQFAVILVARSGSSRFPNKILAKIGEKSVLEYLLIKLQKVRAPVILATTISKVDDQLCVEAQRLGVKHIFRGHELDVAARFKDAFHLVNSDYYVRLNGDNIMFDPSILNLAMEQCSAGQPEVFSNVVSRKFPFGMSVEILEKECFCRSYPKFNGTSDNEHVTQWFYNNKKKIMIQEFEYFVPAKLRGLDLSLDYPGDIGRLQRLEKAIGKSLVEITLNDIVSVPSFCELGFRHGK